MSVKEINLFTDGEVKVGERVYTRLMGGFGEGRAMFTIWQASEFLGLVVDVIRKDFERNENNFEKDVDYRDLKSAKNMVEINKFLKDIGYSQNRLNATSKWLIFSLTGILKLINISDIMFDNIEFLKEYFKVKEISNLKLVRHEINFKNILYAMLSDYVVIKHQFPILNYRVDFFIPIMNLIIEYDEEGHKYSKLKDKKREKDILNEFIKWEKIFADEGEKINANIKIIRVKKGFEAEGIREIMKCVANYDSNLIINGNIMVYKDIKNLYDYFNEIYDFTYFKDEIKAIGY